jgi:hypothetical protein
MSQDLSKELEIIKLQLKLILNEITLLKCEKNYDPITKTSTILTASNLYTNIICRKCKEYKQVINTLSSQKYSMCADCQIKLMEEFESDDEEIDVK